MQYIEYIQNGTGTFGTGWCIPLNYHPSTTSNVKMKVKLSRPINETDGNLTVGSVAGNGKFFRFFTYQTLKMYFDCPNDSNARINVRYDNEVPTEWEMGVSNNTVFLRNLTKNLSSTSENTLDRTFDGDFFVYGPNTDATSTERQKIYYIEMYENDVMVKQWLPAIDNNNVVCLYETVGGTYHYNEGSKTLTAGPILSSIFATPSKTFLANTGETINITVECENAWTVTGNTWLTLSSTGDTGSTTITATAPSYTGTTARTDTLTFTDTVTGDIAEITIKQKKYTSGQPVYLGGNEVTELYLGGNQINEAYLGDVLVYSASMGPAPSLNKTLTVTNIEEPITMGQSRTCSMTGVFDFISSYDDIEMQATNSLTTESGYTGSYDSNTITVTGPFDGSGYAFRCGGLAGGCDNIDHTISVTFTGDTATAQADFTPITDPECECMQMGGTWDGSTCTYPEDPCIADPCMCDPNPDECHCIQQGGTWNGSECVFE